MVLSIDEALLEINWYAFSLNTIRKNVVICQVNAKNIV